MDLASMTYSSRVRLVKRLEMIRELGHSLNNVTLAAGRAVREGVESVANETLADIIGRVAEMNRLAQTIARELQN